MENYLRSDAMTALIQRKARGTSGSMKKISQGDIKEFAILWPPEAARQAFSREVELIDQQLETLSISLKQLETLFQSLLTCAFTGQLTEQWREKHAGEMQGLEERAVRSHIDLERERKKRRQEQQLQWREAGEPRVELLAQLSDDQRELLQVLLSNEQMYATVAMLRESVKQESHSMRENLRVLRDTGLAQEVVRTSRSGGRELVYVSLYRRLLASDLVKEADIARLERETLL